MNVALAGDSIHRGMTVDEVFGEIELGVASKIPRCGLDLPAPDTLVIVSGRPLHRLRRGFLRYLLGREGRLTIVGRDTPAGAVISVTGDVTERAAKFLFDFMSEPHPRWRSADGGRARAL